MDTELYAIQKKLKELGRDPGPLDGVWGVQTREAIAEHLGISRKKATTQPGSAVVEAPWLDAARRELGVHEVAGAASNSKIGDYYQAAVGRAYTDDVPWCAAFVGAMLTDTGYKGTGSLMARSYLDWGRVLDKPRRGCIVVFRRGAPPSGHVAFVDDWDSSKLRCLGGNQSDAVTVSTFSRSAVLGYRWPSEALAG